MAFAATTIWEVQTGGSDSANGGGFDPGNANMATDLAATVATGTAPIVTSASYTFIARDVGHWVFVKAGTNWIPGWYKIASVNAGAATLTASIGSAVLYNNPSIGFGPSIVAGCATTASPTGGTWSIDYSQTASAGITYTDMVIDGTTNTKYTSAGNPVGVNIVGNMIKVTSGTGFTVQRVQIVSVSGVTATCDRALGTVSSTGGHGGLGGAMALLSSTTAAGVGDVAGMSHFVKSGTYTDVQITIYNQQLAEGYGTVRGDEAARPVLQHGSGPTYLVLLSAAYRAEMRNLELKYIGNGSGGYAEYSGSNGLIINCKATNYEGGSRFGFAPYTADTVFINCEAENCDVGFNLQTPGATAVNCYSHASGNYGSQRGFTLQNGGQVFGCIAIAPGNGAGTPGTGFYMIGSGVFTAVNCIAYGCTGTNSIGFDMSEVSNYVGGISINCISVGNANYGFYCGPGMMGGLINCAAYNNGTNYGSGGVAPRNKGYITLTADPFTNAAGGDFTLNNAAGGGALLKNAGWPAAIAGLSPTNYPSVGVYQPQAATPGGCPHLAGIGGGLAG